MDIEILPTNITAHILNFRNFFVASWPSLDELMNHHDWENDGLFTSNWMQVNWEFLVERELLGNNGFLTQFSITHISARILFPNARPNFVVLAQSDRQLLDLKKNIFIPFDKNLRLYSFRTLIDGAFGVYPPFDLACLVLDSTKELFIAPLDQLEFYLDKI